MLDRKAIHDLVDKVLDVQEQTSHYARLELSNYSYDIGVYAMAGGWQNEGDLDLAIYFNRKDGEAKYAKAMAYLDSLLKNEPQAGATVRDSSN